MRRETGFSLIEAVIAIGLVSMVMMALAASGQYLFSLQKSVNASMERSAKKSEIINMMGDPTLCSGAFLDPSGGSVVMPPGVGSVVNVDEVKMGHSTLAKVGQVEGELVVDSIQLTVLEALGTTTTFEGGLNVPRNKLLSELAVKWSKNGSSSRYLGGSELQPMRYKFVAQPRQSNGSLDNCYGTESLPAVCDAFGGIYDEVATPKCQLTAQSLLISDVTASLRWSHSGGGGSGWVAYRGGCRRNMDGTYEWAGNGSWTIYDTNPGMGDGLGGTWWDVPGLGAACSNFSKTANGKNNFTFESKGRHTMHDSMANPPYWYMNGQCTDGVFTGSGAWGCNSSFTGCQGPVVVDVGSC